MRSFHVSGSVIFIATAVFLAAFGGDDFSTSSDLLHVDAGTDAATAGTGGTAGIAGTGGTAGIAGTAGTSQGGSAGTPASGGSAGSPAGGSAGVAGTGGVGGSSGAAGTTAAGAGGTDLDSGLGGSAGSVVDSGPEVGPDTGPVSDCPLAAPRYWCTPLTAFDTFTNLTWQRGAKNQSIQWQKAVDYCANLAIPPGSFRLPTKDELLSILLSGNPTTDPYAFPGIPNPSYFWSGTETGCPIANEAWCVNFAVNTGDVICGYETLTFNARCVK